MNRRGWFGSVLLFAAVGGAGFALVAWKRASIAASESAAANMPEPVESITVAVAREQSHLQTTTSIGTVVALRSVRLRNEIAGTVRDVALEPGKIVEAGTLLVALDVSVEEAELRAQQAQAKVAETLLNRVERASQNRGASEMDVDRARAERDVALANVARTEAVIGRKTLRAPFRARVGLADVHPGQYLHEGTELTTLQGVDDSAYIDFAVAQDVAAGLREGQQVEIVGPDASAPRSATIVALDARVDPATRNAMVRAEIEGASSAPPPGASVRVRVPVGGLRSSVTIPVSALRKGPAGDHVFVIAPDEKGANRAHLRQVHGGTVLGDEVVIESGLQLNEQVAASGSFKLREAVLVAVAQDGGEPQR